MADVNVRAAEASPADLAAVARVAHRTWPDAYRDLLPAAVVEAHLAAAYRPEALADRMRLAGGLFLLAEADGQCVAFCQAQRRPAAPGEADLWAIYVLPQWQGRGVGGRLLRAVLAPLADCRMHVALAAGNERAARFYASHGFVPEGGGYRALLAGHPVEMRSMVRAPQARGADTG
ncbi:MAG: GNAT family N-acetyltransferase [Firmicutes bacterium]|nr:GNAT family N-acetyltransferase [Bacillota bacterium]